MKSLLISFILLSGLILQSGCCNKADCDVYGGDFQIRLMRDGKNAVFGPDAFIQKDSIIVFYEDYPEEEWYITFVDTFQYFYLSVEEGSPMILKWSSTMSDTFTVTVDVTEKISCCPAVNVTSLMHNGQIICTEECEDVVIDVEI